MSRLAIIGSICTCVLIVCGAVFTPQLINGVGRVQAAGRAPCAPPTQASAVAEETAWKLFVAASCTINSDKYPYTKWEAWKEQTQLFQSPSQLLAHRQFRRFHKSVLGEFLQNARANPNAGPKEMLLLPNQGCEVSPFSGRTICEEVRINPDAASYIMFNGLTTAAGQDSFVSAGKQYVFTRPSVEIKADWLALASCSNPPTGVHVENVNGSCYALAGFHLISKLIDKWVWATFEAQNATTNPRRCQVLGCTDGWGSNPPTTSGAPTSLSPALSQLMNDANLAPEWRNYRLDGVQVDFLDSSGKPTVLGNSIIEGESAGSPARLPSSSCITCHARSTAATGAAKPLKAEFVIGTPPPLAPGVIERDFVWALSQAP